MLKGSQILSLQQKLSPQLIQSQLLLAVPSMALENEIKLQLETNPLLEESLEIETDQEPIDNISNDTEQAEKIDEEFSEPEENTYDIDDWYSYSGTDLEGYKTYLPESEDKPDYEVLTPEKLRDSPNDQLHRAGLDEKCVIIGEEIIGSLDDDGYLRDSIDEIIADIKNNFDITVTHKEFEYVLRIIQKFDPIGLASRNIQECLTVQLEELEINEETKKFCISLINDDFENFRLRRFEKISKAYNITLDKVKELFEIIQKLNPVPGNLHNLPEKNYIQPDFYVKVVDDELVVDLYDDYIPNLRVNKRYLSLLKNKKTSKETKEYIKNRFEAAKNFINSIQSRKITMLKVMNAIVNRQRDYFYTGENLKPMYEKDVAADINMDISTVSRTVRNKYVNCDFGTYELKYFFSNPVHTDSGEDVSSKTLKTKIRELIDNENKTKPLSDDKLTKMLVTQGFPIARRTVAKYREAMKIPKAVLRRDIS